jgi:hypothetical protein
MANKPMLVYTADNLAGKPAQSEVQVGDIIKGLHNSPPEQEYEVTYFREPHSPASSGKVNIRPLGGSDREVYVTLIGAEWINRRDRG